MPKNKSFSKPAEKMPIVWIKIPIILIQNYSKLPEKFKINDLKNLCKKENGMLFHRNTYQNWIGFLRQIGIVELKGRMYYKKYDKISEGASKWLKNKIVKYEK